MSGNHEKQQTEAERHQAAGGPMRRARASAWTVFWLTAGTSVLYNCYHAFVGDHMPWYTGAPEGVSPLVVAICVLEFSGAWRENKTLVWAAWLVTGGAMAWSAIAINAVVPHGWAFGLIGDTAALAAMYFLLNGPTAGQAVAAVVRREAELLDAARAERTAREEAARIAAETETALRAQIDEARVATEAAAAQAQAALRAAEMRAESDAETARETALEAAGEAHRTRENALLAQIDAERRAREVAEQGAARWTEAEDRRMAAEFAREASAGELRTTREALEAAVVGRKEAESRAGQAEAKAASAERKLAAHGGRNAGSAGSRKTPRPAGPGEIDARTAALAILDAEPEITGAELAERVHMSERWGQLRKKEYADLLAGVGGAESTEGD